MARVRHHTLPFHSLLHRCRHVMGQTPEAQTKIDNEMLDSSLKMLFDGSSWHHLFFENGRNLVCVLRFKPSLECINKTLTERMPRCTIKGMLTINMEMIPDVGCQENVPFMAFEKNRITSARAASMSSGWVKASASLGVHSAP